MKSYPKDAMITQFTRREGPPFRADFLEVVIAVHTTTKVVPIEQPSCSPLIPAKRTVSGELLMRFTKSHKESLRSMR